MGEGTTFQFPSNLHTYSAAGMNGPEALVMSFTTSSISTRLSLRIEPYQVLMAIMS